MGTGSHLPANSVRPVCSSLLSWLRAQMKQKFQSKYKRFWVNNDVISSDWPLSNDPVRIIWSHDPSRIIWSSSLPAVVCWILRVPCCDLLFLVWIESFLIDGGRDICRQRTTKILSNLMTKSYLISSENCYGAVIAMYNSTRRLLLSEDHFQRQNPQFK